MRLSYISFTKEYLNIRIHVKTGSSTMFKAFGFAVDDKLAIDVEGVGRASRPLP